MNGPQIINVNVPEPCVVCSEHDSTLSPMLLPWRTSEGWWCCKSCTERLLVTRMYPTMNARRIIPTGALPEWFRSIGAFVVSRSSGALTKMAIVDFKCSFSQNEDNGPTTDGRVRLSNGKVYIDMCDETKTYFKQVTIDNLYQNNPEIASYGIVELEFPPYVSSKTQAEWRAAMLAAATAAELGDEETIKQVEAPVETTVAAVEVPVEAPVDTTVTAVEAPVEATEAPAEEEPVDTTVAAVEATEAPAEEEPVDTTVTTVEAPVEAEPVVAPEPLKVDTATQVSAPEKPENATTHTTVPPTPKFSFW